MMIDFIICILGFIGSNVIAAENGTTKMEQENRFRQFQTEEDVFMEKLFKYIAGIHYGL